MSADSPSSSPSSPQSPEQAVEAYERAVSEMVAVAREAGVKESRFGDDVDGLVEVESDYGVGADDAAADEAERLAAAQAEGPSEEELREGLKPGADEAEAEPAREAEAERQAAVVTSYEANATRTLQLYPEAGRAGSRLYQRMEEIHAALEATNDPLIHDPTKPLVIAQMAARELRIPPQAVVGEVVKAAGRGGPVARGRDLGSASMTAPLGGAGSARSKGRCLFVMPSDGNFEEIRKVIQSAQI